MLLKLKSIARHTVGQNAAALGVMQIVNFAVPLLLLPFLTRQLGMEAFGMVAITLAVIQLAFVITDYGFSLSATYSISTHRENTDYVNRKISAIFGAKTVLVTMLAIVLTIISQTVISLESYTPYLLAGGIAIFAQTYQPIWLFQGIERMKGISIYVVLTKALYAILVIQLINGPEDAVTVIYCWGASQLLGLFVSLYFTYTAGYKITLTTLQAIKHEFREGAQFFWSRLAVAIYTSASTIVVGSQSAVQAAQFAVCEQIYKAGQNVASPINNAMYPYMAKNKDWKVFYRILSFMGISITAGCLLLAYHAEFTLALLFGDEYLAATPVLLVFLCTTVVNYFGVTFGYSAYAAIGRLKIANLTVIIAAIAHSVGLLLIYLYSDVTAVSIAACILCTESIVALSRILLFYLSTKRRSDPKEIFQRV